MLLPRSIPVVAFLQFFTSVSAVTLDCNQIVANHTTFNLHELGGPRSVHWLQSQPPSIRNTTFTIDICDPLKRSKEKPSDEQCSLGTRVCAIETENNPNHDHEWRVDRVIEIAGQYAASNSRNLDPRITRFKHDAEESKPEVEGLRIELHGGKYPNSRQGVIQKAIIELICTPDLTGNEGFVEDAGAKSIDITSFGAMDQRRRDDEGDHDNNDLPKPDDGKSLQFVSYHREDEMDVLRVSWKTKYACEGEVGKPPEAKGGWGFFTWFIILLFLLAAAYIIFGSWLNYSRYGARGWDLIPHGDTIRDLPYILKDWMTGLMDRMRGGGSRGGYSAV